MDPPDVEACLRNIARLVKPDGYLFVSGIDIDVRARVAEDLGWTPVSDQTEQIHEGDQSLRDFWPWGYWTIEPINKGRADWRLRYAAVFQPHARVRTLESNSTLSTDSSLRLSQEQSARIPV